MQIFVDPKFNFVKWRWHAVAFSLEAQYDAQDELATIAANALDARKLSIYGGANEVQRNLVAKALLSA